MVTKGFLRLGLPVKQNTTNGGRIYYTVFVQDLIDFLKNNQNAWDTYNLEIGALGEEWDWLRAKRQKDIDNSNAWKRIMSEEEFAKIFSMYQNGTPVLEIANELNKPYDLIICILGLDKKLNHWRIDEIVFLMENYDTLSFNEIGPLFGRTRQAVNTKAFNLGLIKDKTRVRRKNS